MYLKVRLLFDPPISSSTMEAIKNSINELEWRLHTEVEIFDDKEDNNNVEVQ